MFRAVVFALMAVGLAGCAAQEEVIAPPVELGNFALGHNVVVAPRVSTASALSREATEEQLTTSLKAAIAERMDRYEGTRQYHLGVSIEGYVLARGGVPVVASPKSAMMVLVTVWDDEKGEKINVPPEQLVVLEDIDGESIFGSGWLQTPETQLEGLSQNVAEAIEEFLLTKNNEYGWFEDEEEAKRRTAATEQAAAEAEAERRDDAPPERIEPLASTAQPVEEQVLPQATDSGA